MLMVSIGKIQCVIRNKFYDDRLIIGFIKVHMNAPNLSGIIIWSASMLCLFPYQFQSIGSVGCNDNDTSIEAIFRAINIIILSCCSGPLIDFLNRKFPECVSTAYGCNWRSLVFDWSIKMATVRELLPNIFVALVVVCSIECQVRHFQS